LIYHLLYPLHTTFSSFNVFRYITFRTIYAAITALVICFILGPWMIRKLQSLQIGQPIREDGPDSHLSKKGTPTMGGVLIIFATVISTFLWANLTVNFIWMILMVTISFGLIGMADDIRKLTSRSSRGVPGKVRLAGEVAIALFISLILFYQPGFTSNITLPFFKTVLPDLGWGYVLLSTFIIVGTANAVNLTDGLDGLAIMPVIMVGSALGVFAYVTGSVTFSKYLLFPHIPGVGELLIFCSAMAGAGLAFLWFNTHPAQVFMGDVGALALGGALGTIAVIVRQEIVLAIMGGIFVVEALSVMAQVAWFKFTKRRYGEGRRLLKMAPLHHHFEKSGWKETQVVVRFWIITMLLCLIGLSTLKLR